ncbi:MAG: nucleotidyltransferase family protein, partial [Thermocrispum sp.]
MAGFAGLLLAAGAGSRFGRPKALVPFAGVPLAQRGAGMLAAAGCDPVLVVLGAAAEEVRAAAVLSPARVVRNPDWASGLASSLRAGLAALPPGVAAVVVALADQP